MTSLPLAPRHPLGGYRGRSTVAATVGRVAMVAVSARHPLLPLALIVAVFTAAPAQTAAPAPSGATAAWTLKMNGDIRWQQVTPAGALLLSTDAAPAGGGIQRGQGPWGKTPPWRLL